MGGVCAVWVLNNLRKWVLVTVLRGFNTNPIIEKIMRLLLGKLQCLHPFEKHQHSVRTQLSLPSLCKLTSHFCCSNFTCVSFLVRQAASAWKVKPSRNNTKVRIKQTRRKSLPPSSTGLLHRTHHLCWWWLCACHHKLLEDRKCVLIICECSRFCCCSVPLSFTCCGLAPYRTVQRRLHASETKCHLNRECASKWSRQVSRGNTKECHLKLSMGEEAWGLNQNIHLS
jgi:hypothetical protein